ncbi:PucR family transcriptional regulator [Acetobacterium sp. UBA5834]|jgi:hypothetical protein|uniref:PucR family transcriptional regulator n=1 Tax=Acetobacterium sp. UBA5834 TaxID=1945907 RepID=UPI0025807588|nr:helix-turn-helix domain-containing protein [Acetobacterium sp. UBA5834]
MLLPVSLIENSIREFLDEERCFCKDTKALFYRPVFYQCGMKATDNQLVLIDCSRLAEVSELFLYPAVICINMPDYLYTETFQTVLVLKDGTSITAVSNCLHTLFQRCENWLQNLQTLTWEYESLDKLLDLSKQMFDNPLNIMNNDFSIIASNTSFNAIYEHLDIPPFDSQGRLNPETVNCFKVDPLYNEVKTYEDSFLYPANILGARTLCGNLFWQKEFMARLVMIEALEPFKPWDRYFFDILKHYVQKAFNQFFVNQLGDTLLNQILYHLITGEEYSRTKLLNALHSKSWSCNETYGIVFLQPSTQDFNNNTLRYFVMEINEHIHDCCAIEMKENIAIVAALKNYGDSIKKFAKDFTLFIREGNFRTGYSNAFFDIEDAADHYKQAQIAYQYGNLLNPMIWQHYFYDYAMDYILHKATEEIGPSFLCAPGIIALKAYDQEKGSDFLHTLDLYFEYNQNTVRCAKALFIQRGTLLYRLEKIEKISGMSLKDPQQLFYIQASLKILKTKK